MAIRHTNRVLGGPMWELSLGGLLLLASLVYAEEGPWERAKDHWAFQPLQLVPLQKVEDTGLPVSDIDQFVLAQLKASGLSQVEDADKQSLLRRLCFDLTGLPPSPEDVRAFAEDTKPDAFEMLVDQLLDSPQFGEKWGRHWLDVARYAESSGKEANISYPHAWRYRDYVIRSLNEDKPYDQFIREQISGDLMPARDDLHRAELSIATGYLAIGAKSHNERNREQFVMDLVDEQIDSMSRAILGMTIACARCHDHKFDPISTKDYYAMAGIFLSTETCFGTIQTQGNRRSGELLALPHGAVTTSGQHLSRRERAKLERYLKGARIERDELADEVRRDRRQGSSVNQRRSQQLRRLRSRIARAEAQLDGYDEKGNPIPYSMGTRERTMIRDARVLARGEIKEPGDRVPRGFAKIVPAGSRPVNRQQSGRLELAQWLTDDDNPLTARVMANRVWKHLFGHGLVNTMDNFGMTGLPPSHPGLLDYLAIRLQDNGWSLKNLIREIVTSRVYRLSSRFERNNFEVDPENRLLWRMNRRRLEAEAIRDTTLAVAGLLDLEPPAGSAVAMAGDGYIGRDIRPNLLAKESRKRSVYLPVVRDMAPEMMDLFDFAEPSLVTGSRDETTVPSQALFLLNSPRVMHAAEAMAKRVLAASQSNGERVGFAYCLAYSRPPTSVERQQVRDFFDRFTNAARRSDTLNEKPNRTAWIAFCQSLIAGSEFRYLD